MPGVPLHLDTADLIRRYERGETPREIAAQVGGSAETIRRRLRAAGKILTTQEASRRYRSRPEARQQLARALAASNMVRRRADLPAAAMVRDYLAGASQRDVATKYGCSQPAVRRVLRDSGLNLRDMSSAGKLRTSHMTRVERAASTSAANAANRGRARTPAAQRAIARGKEVRLSQNIGPDEEGVATALTEAGLQPRRQVAVGRYNLDIATGDLAVEIHRHPHGPHLDRVGLHRRVDDLTNTGWHVLYVWCPSGINTADLQQVVALAQEPRLHPPTRGEYRVFRCEGTPPPRRGRKAYKGTFVATTRGLTSIESTDRRIRANA